MGTRSLTVLTDSNGSEICVMYRQFDGYLGGHGKDLANFLSGVKVVNWLSGRNPKVANGMGCLAAQIVDKFKTEPGGVYLHAAGTRDCGEDYTYFVTGEIGKEPIIKVDSGDECGEYDGPASGFDGFLKKLEELNE